VSLLRKYWMWVALLLVVLASWWVMGLDDDAPADARRGTKSATTATRKTASARTAAAQYDPATALTVIARGFAPREAMNKLHRDPFTVVSFEPPPPPPPPPPKPVAPPLRFKYLGVLRDGDDGSESENKERAVFLDNGGQLLIARKGDTLAGQYRVLDISDTSMQLEYTPLAERQTLNFGR
jgi:hypothetical protein